MYTSFPPPTCGTAFALTPLKTQQGIEALSSQCSQPWSGYTSFHERAAFAIAIQTSRTLVSSPSLPLQTLPVAGMHIPLLPHSNVYQCNLRAFIQFSHNRKNVSLRKGGTSKTSFRRKNFLSDLSYIYHRHDARAFCGPFTGRFAIKITIHALANSHGSRSPLRF